MISSSTSSTSNLLFSVLTHGRRHFQRQRPLLTDGPRHLQRRPLLTDGADPYPGYYCVGGAYGDDTSAASVYYSHFPATAVPVESDSGGNMEGMMPSSPTLEPEDLLSGGVNGGGLESGTYYSHQQSQSQSCNCVVSADRQHNMAPADTDGRDGEQCVGRKRGAATRTENEGHKQQTTKRRYKGVSRNEYGRYEARIIDKNYSGSINVFLGSYGTEDEAAKAYDLAALKYRGHTINFPVENYRDEIEKMKLMEKEEYVLYLRRKNKRSKYTGVRGNVCGRYEARIIDKNYSGYIHVFLGSYDTEDEAAKAYDLAALKYRGHTINFPVENYRDEIEKMKLMEKEEYVLHLKRESKRSKKQTKRSKHRYKGIQRKGSKYRAIFREKGKEVYIGSYDIEDEAARAYDLLALKYWGPDAIINFPVENYRDEIEKMNTMEREEYVAFLKSAHRKRGGFCRGTSIYRGVATPVRFQEDDDFAQVLEDMLLAEAHKVSVQSKKRRTILDRSEPAMLRDRAEAEEQTVPAAPATLEDNDDDDDLAKVMEDMLSDEAEEPTVESTAALKFDGDDFYFSYDSFFNFSEEDWGVSMPASS